MTEDLPIERDVIRCTDCNQQVTLQREERQLRVSCDCETMSIKVATILPDGWQA